MKILLLEHPRKIAQVRCNDIANTPLSSSVTHLRQRKGIAERNYRRTEDTGTIL